MTRHLRPVEQPSGTRRLNSRREIDEWARERWATLAALLEAERRSRASEPEQAQLDLERAA
jgi:hypothetical protein